MLDSNTLDWIRLSNINGIGNKKFWSLINYYKTASEALKHISLHCDNTKKIFNYIFIEKFLHNNKCKVILATDEKFPDSLKNDYYCPPVLYYRGDINLLSKCKISVIGARNSSISGKTIASNMAESLAPYFVITSGMAHGIDTSALTAAINSGHNALAILPFGFENIYPKDNLKLFDRIAENGLVITSVFPSRKPDPGMFHARNRLLVLLSKGIVVIEAAVKSGTMSTTNLALDLGKEIMVVPGSPLDHRYYGSNLLIKNGAHLVQNAQDVIDIMSEKAINNKLNINIDSNNEKTINSKLNIKVNNSHKKVINNKLGIDVNDNKELIDSEKNVKSSINENNDELISNKLNKVFYDKLNIDINTSDNNDKLINNKLNIDVNINKKNKSIIDDEIDKNINIRKSHGKIIDSKNIKDIILSKLSTVPTTIDELVIETNFAISKILSAVSELVSAGKAIRTPSNSLIIS